MCLDKGLPTENQGENILKLNEYTFYKFLCILKNTQELEFHVTASPMGRYVYKSTLGALTDVSHHQGSSDTAIGCPTEMYRIHSTFHGVDCSLRQLSSHTDSRPVESKNIKASPG